MCGLAGMAGNITARGKEGWQDLLEITKLRGLDATGVFSVRSNNDVDWIKMVGPPESLFDRKSYDTVVKGFPKVLAGHCRHKTFGDNSNDNAHPYEFDNVIGMHNGTLKSFYQMEGWESGRTDSYALYHEINEGGAEIIEKLDSDGAWALVFWDKVQNRLNFIRNDQRPLWFAWTKDKKTIIWASEPWMFGAFNRKEELWDGKSTVEGEADRSPYFQIPPNQLWSFTVNDRPVKDEKYLTLHPIKTIEAKGKSVVNFTNKGGGSYNYHSNRNLSRGGEVANPFQPEVLNLTLDDAVDDVGVKLSPTPTGGVMRTPVGSGITPSGGQGSEDISSKVLDFRRGVTHGTNASREKLSLLQNNSKDSQLNSKGEQSLGSNVTSSTSHRGSKSVSIRWIEKLRSFYIHCNKRNIEISEQEFEKRTNAVCGFCKQPVGGLEEVEEFLTKEMNSFICSSCAVPPEVSLVG